jgi:hypothetical protein
VWCWSWKYEIYRYFVENALADNAKIGSLKNFELFQVDWVVYRAGEQR